MLRDQLELGRSVLFILAEKAAGEARSSGSGHAALSGRQHRAAQADQVLAKLTQTKSSRREETSERLRENNRTLGENHKRLVVIEVTLTPGGGHAFHKHPQQEEVIYVVDGEVEQWREQEKQVLGPGDSVFLPGGTVHASFNVSDRDAKLLAILAPAVGDDDGYEVEEVADQPPWNALRE